MSGILVLRAGVIAALRGDAALTALVNRVEDGGSPRVSAPALLIGAMSATEWGARGVNGLIVRVPMSLLDTDEADGRLRAAEARVAAVMADLPDAIEGWRIGAVVMERARHARTREGWAAAIDWRVRMARGG